MRAWFVRGAPLFPTNEDCRLRKDFIERIVHNECSIFNIIDPRHYGENQAVRVQYAPDRGYYCINRVETFPESDAHIVDYYRRPGPKETYSQYKANDDHWRLVGFGKRICDCKSVNDAAIIKWRDFFATMTMGAGDPEADVLVALFQLIWPGWVQPDMCFHL
jgi:hypothetical protein